MTHTWEQSDPSTPLTPLTDEQRAAIVAGGELLPSGEEHFFDMGQPLPLNETFPSPTGKRPDGMTWEDFFEESGVYKTNAPEDPIVSQGSIDETGVFHYNKLDGQFSSASDPSDNLITDFTIFNAYIHHEKLQIEGEDDRVLKIPYLSTYTVSDTRYDPYKYYTVAGLQDVLNIINQIT